MAYPSVALIDALRKTYEHLQTSPLYSCGHLGSCNCGHFVQVVTQKSVKEIHEAALRCAGDWGEVIVEHCSQSHLPVDYILSELYALGLTPADIAHFEDLSDPEVLVHVVSPGVYLARNDKHHVLLYLQGWIMHLEQTLSRSVKTLESQSVLRAG